MGKPEIKPNFRAFICDCHRHDDHDPGPGKFELYCDSNGKLLCCRCVDCNAVWGIAEREA